jgi:RNA polymerase sigma-70 factor (ECF subfamily)
MEARLAACATQNRAAGSAGGIPVEGFEHIVVTHQRRIHRILLTLLRDEDAADTLTQEVFLRAFQKRATFRGDASVGTWLIRIALNLARDHRKSRRLAFWRHLLRIGQPGDMTDVAPWVPDPGPSVERRIVAREQLAAVQAAVDRLAHQQRTCFLLRFVEAMTVEEIAQALHLEAGTVKTHLTRAVGAVRRQLAEREQPCEDI